MENERRFYEDCTRDLITSLTGFEEDDENFQLCLDFALSHFIARNHPDLDWFKVKRKIQGLCEKYLIESQLEKSRKLQELTNSFFEAVAKESDPQKGVSYSVLSIICSLCGVGDLGGFTGVKNRSFKGAGDSEAIDWYKYLREDDITFCSCSDDDESDWSDLESSREVRFCLPCSPEASSVDSGIGVTPDTGAAPPFPPLGPFEPYKPPTSREVVRLVRPYWDPRYQSFATETCDNKYGLNFTSFWENHLAEKLPIYTPQTNVVIKEAYVLREIIWMLHGIKSTFLFLWKNDHFVVRKHVHLNQLTEGTLHDVLTGLCPYGEKMVHLQEFITQTNGETQSNVQQCHTYKAYAKGLVSCLHPYVHFLISLEEHFIDQTCTMTISQLVTKLEEQLEYLSLLSSIHARVVDPIPAGSSSFECATLFLDALWKEVSEYSLCKTKKSHLQCVLKLFLISFHPYICMTEAAAVHGELIDPYSEYIIQSNPDVDPTDTNFWQDGLSLQPSYSKFKGYFMNVVAEEILLASLSTKMLKTLDAFYDIDCYAKYSRDTLFSAFLAKFEEVYKSLVGKFSSMVENENKEASQSCNENESKEASQSCSENENKEASQSCNKNESVSSEPKLSEEQDPTLPYQWDALNLIKSKCADFAGYDRMCGKVLDLIQPGSLVLLDKVIEYSLMPCIMDICTSSKSALVQELKTKYNLMEHFSAMKKYFLLESGDRMFTFYTEIFDKILDSDDWYNNTFISHIFKDAISCVPKEEEKRLFMYVNDMDSSVSSDRPLSQLRLLNLTYKMGWPCNLIINESIQKTYSDVFIFLLQVKCAKYCLDDLYCYPLKLSKKTVPKVAKWWSRKEEMQQHQVIHAMYILRMKILHFINGFHSYIMTSILHCSWLELDAKLESAESFGDIIKSVNDYALALREQCFLNAKHPHLQEQIHNILNLAVRYHSVWKSGIEKISIDDLKKIEQEFISRFSLVTTYLKKPWKRGEHLHLEILANAIATNCHLQRLFV